MSTKESAYIAVPEFYSVNQRTYKLAQDIERSQFESLIQTHINDAMQLVDDVLHKARLQTSQIHQVLLIGGTSRIPLLKKEMYRTFGQTKVVEVENADTIIAEGAAIISYHNWTPYTDMGSPMVIFTFCLPSRGVGDTLSPLIRAIIFHKINVVWANLSAVGFSRI